MKIDVKLIKNYYKQIKQINEDYEINYLNFYNELNYALENWQDNNSKKFNEQITIEKNNYKKIILNLKQLETNLKIIYEKYETIGNQINYQKENKESMFSKFEQYINKINDTINYISNLDLSFCEPIKNTILSIQKNLIDNKNKIETIKNTIKNIIVNIEQKESEISRLLSKIEYLTINEINYKNYE